MTDPQQGLGRYQAEAKFCIKMLGHRSFPRLICTYLLPWPCVSSSSPSRVLSKGYLIWTSTKSHLDYWVQEEELLHVWHCTAHPGASIHFWHSKTQAQAPRNRSCLLHKKNSFVLSTVVGFQSNLDLKEHILSFSSSTGSFIYIFTLFQLMSKGWWCTIPFWNATGTFPISACRRLEGQIRVPLRTPLLSTLGLWQAGPWPLHQEMVNSAFHICIWEELVPVTNAGQDLSVHELDLEKIRFMTGANFLLLISILNLS